MLHEAAKLDIRINKIAKVSDALNIKGTEISSLLDIKELRSYKNLDNMNFFVLEQLLDSTESHLLTWDQLKHIRNRKTKGRTPSWFKKLEERVIKENSSREVKDAYKVAGPNREAIKIQSQDISKDRWKKNGYYSKEKKVFISEK